MIPIDPRGEGYRRFPKKELGPRHQKAVPLEALPEKLRPGTNRLSRFYSVNSVPSVVKLLSPFKDKLPRNLC
jgi:hypothetical protein